MGQVPQFASKAVVGGIVGRLRDGVATDDGSGSVLVVGGIVDKVDLAEQLALMMLELAHHVGDGQ